MDKKKVRVQYTRCVIICLRGTRSRRNRIPDSITEKISIAHAVGNIEEN